MHRTNGVVRLLLALALIVAVTLPLARLTRAYPEGDSDRYFHLALARAEADHGFVPTIPQAEDIGWGERYPEKELLFHVVTAAAWKIGGERAVLAVPYLILVATIFLSFLCARCVLPEGAALAVSLGWLALSPNLLVRLTYLRAFGLAVCVYQLAILGLLRRDRRLLALGAGLTASAHHAFYVMALPLALGLLRPVVSSRARGARARLASIDRFYLAGFGGLVAGIVLTPYFPLNVEMMWQNVLVAFAPSALKAPIDYGAEIMPIVSNYFLYRFAPHLAMLALGIFVLGRETGGGTRRRDAGEFQVIVAATGAFWVLAAIQPRALEFGVPMVAVLSAMTLARLNTRAARVAAAAWGLALLTGAVIFYDRGPSVRPLAPATLAAVARLPAPESRPGGGKVLNCGSFLSAYLYYARPDLRFVDTIDPSLIYRRNPELFWMRESLRNGVVTDPWSMIREVFHADYVLCSDPPANAQLELDPRFRRLYPETLSPGDLANPNMVMSFELARERPPELADHYEVAELPVGDPRPAAARGWTEALASETAASFLNLESALDRTGTAVCRAVRVPLTVHAGATQIGLGIGPDVRLWLNDRPLTAWHAEGRPRMVASIAALGAPLRASDRLVAVVCSRAGEAYLGLALSFWTRADLARLCAWKGSPDGCLIRGPAGTAPSSPPAGG